jgi:membrane-associated phospholipid phosphatase
VRQLAAALSSRELARGLAQSFSIQGLRYGQQAGRVESGSKLPHSKAHGARNIFRAKPVRNDVEKTLFSRQLGSKLRITEKTLLAFFAALFIASLTLSLPGATLGVLAVLNVIVGCLIVALSKDDLVERSRMASAIRDWLPALLMLLAYRESGLFIRPDPAHRLDHLFILWDRTMLHGRWVEWALYSCAPGLQHYLEMFYLLCYPLVPLGFAALYLARSSITAHRERGGMPKDLSFRGVPRPRDDEESRRVMFDKFWTAVLLATLFCYAVYPFFPLTPPRVLFNDVPGPTVPPLLRNMNLWVLDHFSVQACLFPSAHAAAVTATALAVRAYMPRLGILFCVAALSVAAATVYGRYHYMADTVAGVLVGVVAFVVTRRIHKA